LHNVKITLKNGSSTTGIVEVDGKIMKCKRVEFKADINDTPTVILTIVPNIVEIKADAFVLEDTTSMGDEWRSFKKYDGGNE